MSTILLEPSTDTKEELSPLETKVKVGMVQVNNSFAGQGYLPLTLGYLHSHARTHAENFDDFEFLLPIYKRIHIEQSLEQLEQADIVAFSTYVWNFEISRAIAKSLKQRNPNIVTIAGGYEVPETGGLELFLRTNPFFDIAINGEGERAFTEFLEAYPERDWHTVPSAGFIDSSGKFVQTPKAERIQDLNEIPSPFLTGYFDPLMKANPDEGWIGLFETNRGCPFLCSFCAWGGKSGAKKRMAEFDLEGRIFPEIQWFGENKVEYIFSCDANFGIFGSESHQRRDLRIAQRFARVKQQLGFPQRLSVQNTKNSTEDSYRIQGVLHESGLDKGVLLAMQSLHPPTLEAVNRKNIKNKTFIELQRRATAEGKITFTDLILGLPLETYESFAQGVNTLIELGQHNRIQFNNLSLLENTEMVSPEYQEKYGLQVMGSQLINIHGALGDISDGILEKQRLVVGTNTMPGEEWVKTRNFAYMAGLLHFNKLLQIPNVILNTQYGVKYSDIFDAFVKTDSPDSPVLSEVSSSFSEQARSLQRGGLEYVQSEQWLQMWWPPDEHMLIHLATQGKLPAFYRESESTLGTLLQQGGIDYNPQVLSDAIKLNQDLLKQPFQQTDLTLDLQHNIWEVYQEAKLGQKPLLAQDSFRYNIDRTTDTWDSWEDWCRRMVWWMNKKGAYLYSCSPLNTEK